ncbi:MAG: Uma2 family endonuclease [Cyanobacteria bacterium J06581_3]
MVQTPLKPITLEDFLQRPETKPASEFIDGQVIQKPMPKAAHSGIQTDLASAINASIRSTRTGRAFNELRCTFGGSSIVPDIAVLPWADIPRSDNGELSGELLSSPTWMIEILSPGQSQSKVVKKILRAIEFGTQMGWLIDPAEKCVFVYWPDLPPAFYEEPTAKIPVVDFASAFSLTVQDLINWLYD